MQPTAQPLPPPTPPRTRLDGAHATSADAGYADLVSQRRSFLNRLTANAHKLDADELADEVAQLSCVRLDCLTRGTYATVAGRLRSVMYNPHGDVQTLEAELYDGTASIELVWLGQRRIAGLEPGRRLVARGRIGEHDGQMAMYNPWYELRSNA
jgi:hypothetical protein